MFQSLTSALVYDEIDVLNGAVFSWCAERRISLRSQEGVSAASAAIDLYLAGYETQEALLAALNDSDSLN